MKCISIEDLQAYCNNQKDHSITPNDFQRMNTFDVEEEVKLKEQELGHWIFLTDCSNSGVYCSECNTKVFDSYPFKKKLSYFCPHCGTRMECEIEKR